LHGQPAASHPTANAKKKNKCHPSIRLRQLGIFYFKGEKSPLKIPLRLQKQFLKKKSPLLQQGKSLEKRL